jgi:hypothetical protein
MWGWKSSRFCLLSAKSPILPCLFFYLNIFLKIALIVLVGQAGGVYGWLYAENVLCSTVGTLMMIVFACVDSWLQSSLPDDCRLE